MLLHGVKDTEFEIFHGDTLTNDWDMLRETNPAKKPSSTRSWPTRRSATGGTRARRLAEDVRFKSHGVAPKSAADFAFLLHGLPLPEGRRGDGDHPAARRAVPRRGGGADPDGSCWRTGTWTR